MTDTKIVIIGACNVGQAIAYTLMVRRQAREIIIIDKDRERAASAAKDIAHGTGFFSQVWIKDGDYSECDDASLVIFNGRNRETAGTVTSPAC